MMTPRPRRRPSAAALGAALFGTVATVCYQSVGFLAAPSKVLGLRPPRDDVLLAGCETPAPRGEAESLVTMYGRFPDRTRTQGGGRKAIRVNRKPVLGYAVAFKDPRTGRVEPPGSVLRRMWNMYEQDFVQIHSMNNRYHRRPKRMQKFLWDKHMQLGRRKAMQRVKRSKDQAWEQWVSTEGKKLGFQNPIVYTGPSLPYGAEEETALNDAYKPENRAVEPGSKRPDVGETMKRRRFHKFNQPIYYQMQPGCWPDDDGPKNLFNLYRRPLKKFPIDIIYGSEKKIKGRGNVI